MKKALFAALSLVTFHALAITSIGGTDCGKFVESPRIYDQWVGGYLSGLNSTLGSEKQDPLHSIKSIEQASVWLQTYCKANPFDTLQGAANRLYEALVEQRKNR